MYRQFKLTLLCAALAVPVFAAPQDRDDQRERRRDAVRYEDPDYHDSHEWNEREDRAYRRYLAERHQEYHDFAKARKREQRDYWKWRHQHSDDDRDDNRRRDDDDRR